MASTPGMVTSGWLRVSSRVRSSTIVMPLISSTLAGDEISVTLHGAEESLHPARQLGRGGAFPGELEVVGGQRPPVVEGDVRLDAEAVERSVLAYLHRLGQVELRLSVQAVIEEATVEVGDAVVPTQVVGERRVEVMASSGQATRPAPPRVPPSQGGPGMVSKVTVRIS